MRTITFSLFVIASFFCGQFSYSQTITGRSGIDIMSNGTSFFTSLVNNGSISSRFDIVFIGDGFKASEQGAFNSAVASAVVALQTTPPYSNNMCSFNIWRVNVVSPETGVDHPGHNIFVNTALDCSFSNGSTPNAERCVYSNSPAKCYAAAGNAPGVDAVFVLLNDQQGGGCANGFTGIVCSSIPPGFENIITHELGHKIGSLADEYSCYLCNGTDDNRNYIGVEPSAVNLTANRNRSTTKWAALINTSTTIPTIDDTPSGITGLWEGGAYYGLGIFRPQSNCMMRNNSPMCTVCMNEMNRTFSRFQDGCTTSRGMPLTSRPHLIMHSLLASAIRFRLFDQRYFINWPIPLCKVCREEETRIILDGINAASFKVEVLDEKNNSMAQNSAKESKSSEVSFIPKAGARYYLQVSARNKNATGKMNNATISMTVNNVKFPLD
jgi:hypothetical protein